MSTPDGEAEEQFVILTMAISVELEGELKLRLNGLAAATKGLKVPPSLYVGMFAGTSVRPSVTGRLLPSTNQTKPNQTLPQSQRTPPTHPINPPYFFNLSYIYPPAHPPTYLPGATKPKPFQRKRPNLSHLPSAKLPSLHDMRSMALKVGGWMDEWMSTPHT